MLNIEKSEASDKFTNMMSLHAGDAHGTLVLIDKLTNIELKHFAMIGIEARVREVLGARSQAEDLTPDEVSTVIEAILT